MATRHPDEDRDARKQQQQENEGRDTRKQTQEQTQGQANEEGQPFGTQPTSDGADPRRDQETVDPANDPYRDDPRGEDPKRLPSSALNPQERHDRDIEDLKAAGHDFNPTPVVDTPKDDNDNPEDPKLQQVTAEEQRTRREDGLDVPMPPSRSAMDDPEHPLHHLKDA